MFCYKIHRSGGDVILAACDSDIMGKKLTGGDLQIEIREAFYGNEKIGEEVIELFKEASIINLIGNKIVSLAIKNGYAEKSSVKKISGVSHAQIIRV